MIPPNFITEWRSVVPWISDDQVEQDLVISRALVEIYTSEALKDKLAFRGGTALHKTHLAKPYRYSEDLDFIQVAQEPIGETFDELRKTLDPWLGEPRRELKQGLVKLLYRFQSTSGKQLKLKVEINSREHFVCQGLIQIPFAVDSRWYSGSAQVTSLSLPWLMGSKLRALYQRRKSRDLFDLTLVLNEGRVDPSEIVEKFYAHLSHDKLSVSRSEFEENLHKKLNNTQFTSDLDPLLPEESSFDLEAGYTLFMKKVAPLLKGEEWKGREKKAE